MLSSEELQNILSDIESDRIEKTVSTDKTSKFGEAICAFANDFPNHGLPGYLLIGVDDNGVTSGLQVTDKLLQKLAALRSDGNIQPLPALTVQKYVLPDNQGEIALVEVFPSDLPPVRYKGRVWIRVGPRRAIANEMEERLLSEKRQIRYFDALPCMKSSLNDLNLNLFKNNYLLNAVSPEIIEENQRTIEEQLSSLRFYDLNRDCPTYAGLLLFGKDVNYWLTGAYVQFLKIAGTQLSDYVEFEQVVSGDLASIINGLDSLIKLNNHHKPVFKSLLVEEQQSLYPSLAIREILLNAVMHRQYDSSAPIRFYWMTDHIEIQSPGGLYGIVTPEDFRLLRKNDYRNPTLAEAMKTLGYVNKFGLGLRRAQDALKRNGNPPAEFLFDSTYMLVTIRTNQ